MTEQTTTMRFQPPARPPRPGHWDHRNGPVKVTRREPRPAPKDPVIVGLGPAFKVRYALHPCHDCGEPLEPGTLGRFRRVAGGRDLLVHASCVSSEEWATLYRGRRAA